MAVISSDMVKPKSALLLDGLSSLERCVVLGIGSHNPASIEDDIKDHDRTNDPLDLNKSFQLLNTVSNNYDTLPFIIYGIITSNHLCVQELTKGGKIAPSTTAFGKPMLYWAAQTGNPIILNSILAQKVNVNEISGGSTALLSAMTCISPYSLAYNCKWKDKETSEIIRTWYLDKKGKIELPTGIDLSATFDWNIEVISKLLEAGADPRLGKISPIEFAKDPQKFFFNVMTEFYGAPPIKVLSADQDNIKVQVNMINRSGKSHVIKVTCHRSIELVKMFEEAINRLEEERKKQADDKQMALLNRLEKLETELQKRIHDEENLKRRMETAEKAAIEAQQKASELLAKHQAAEASQSEFNAEVAEALCATTKLAVTTRNQSHTNVHALQALHIETKVTQEYLQISLEQEHQMLQAYVKDVTKNFATKSPFHDRIETLRSTKQGDRFLALIAKHASTTIEAYRVLSSGIVERRRVLTKDMGVSVLGFVGKNLPSPFGLAFSCFSAIAGEKLDRNEIARYTKISNLLPIDSSVQIFCLEVSCILAEKLLIERCKAYGTDISRLKDDTIETIAKKTLLELMYVIYNIDALKIDMKQTSQQLTIEFTLKIINQLKNSKTLLPLIDKAIQASGKVVSTSDKPPAFVPGFEAAKAADSNIVYVYPGAGSTRVQMYTPLAKAY